MLERAVEVHRALAKQLVEDGASISAPPLDPTFLLKLEEHKKELERIRLEKKLQKKSLEEQEGEKPMAVVAPALASLEEESDKKTVEVQDDGKPMVAVAPVEDETMASVVERLRARLTDEDVDLIQIAIMATKVEDLQPALQEHYRKVEANGSGACGKCRYKGCMNCDVAKAWIYCVKVELGFSSGGAVVDTKNGSIKGGGPVEALAVQMVPRSPFVICHSISQHFILSRSIFYTVVIPDLNYLCFIIWVGLINQIWAREKGHPMRDKKIK